MLDYWATLSNCLTDLDIAVDITEDIQLLQPAYLIELSRLTRLAIDVLDDTSGDAYDYNQIRYTLRLPQLKVLCLTNLYIDTMELHCPQLQLLRIVFCAMDVYLQASLEHLHLEDSSLDVHKGFPSTNLAGLTYLCIDDADGPDAEALPLMTRLHTLKFQVWQLGRLPAKLPNSLRDLTLVFSTDERWDSLVIPLVQQLPEVESIRIDIHSHRRDLIGHLSLDHNLRPFLAMRSLRHLQFWNSMYCKGNAPQLWKASALRQLGELEAEVVRSGKKLQLRY